jgi:hypothetical protein
VSGYGGLIGGIDRKDSSIGYILSNCLPCCSFCNMAKRSTNYDLFVNQLEQLRIRLNLRAENA